MPDDVLERREPAVMVEPSLVDLFHVPQRPQRRGAIALVRRSHRLEIINSDLGCVELPREEALPLI